jgi:O-antigen biosynthesis protein
VSRRAPERGSRRGQKVRGTQNPHVETDKAVLSLPFDSYERYRVTADVIDIIWPARRGRSVRILDVGGHFSSLKHFLPQHQVVVADLKEPPAFTYRASVPFLCDAYVRAAGGKLPFPDHSFDLVTAHDTLEHVPETDREMFLDDLLRVAKRFVLIHGPVGEPETGQAERRLARFWRTALGWEIHPLLEHLEMGLPSREFIERFLRKRRISFTGIPNGNVILWLSMMSLTHYVEALPGGSDLHEQLDRNFNALLASHDFTPPCYRTAYVGAKNRKDASTLRRISDSFSTHKGAEFPVQQIADLESLIRALEAHANHARSHETDLRTKIHELNVATAGLQRAINEKDARIEERNVVLAAKELELREQQRAGVERDRMIQEKDRAIGERDAAIKHKDLLLASADAKYEMLTNTIGWRLLQKIRNTIRRLAPPGTRRAGLVRKLGHGMEILITQGFFAFVGSLLTFWRWLPRLFQRPPPKERPLPVGPPEILPFDEQYKLWLAENELSTEDRQQLRNETAGFSYRPLISIVVPVHDTEPRWLREMVASVFTQAYESWELCIADDGSKRWRTRWTLRRLRHRDPRVKITRLRRNAGISDATNAALALATGEFIAFLDHDDELRPDALAEVVRRLNDDRDLDLIYSDEDKRALDGDLVEPFFKPDWSPDLLMSVNYLNHLTVARRELVDQLGGLRSEFDGSQDYDLFLRVTELTDRITHISRPLYAWRKSPGSAAADVRAKDFAYEAGRRALTDAIRRRGLVGEVQDAIVPGRYRVRYQIQDEPLVTIIIPTRDNVNMLRRCIQSIQTRSTYARYELLVVDNDSRDPETLEYLDSFEGRVLKYPHPFNYARLMNEAARVAEGDMLLLLNNDTEVIKREWIEAMLEHGQRSEVAAVGARLLYPDGRPQHEGIVMGLGGGSAGNVDHAGFFDLGETIRNCSAVTGACMLVRTEVYWELGGFEERLGVAFNDVDFCLRAIEKGYQVVYTPYAQLYHHESATRGRLHPMEDEAFFRARWGKPGEYRDPYYNPNLDLRRPFRLRLNA